MLSRITPRLLACDAIGMVVWAVGSEQVLVLESVHSEPISSVEFEVVVGHP